jgi:hypothetical protein
LNRADIQKLKIIDKTFIFSKTKYIGHGTITFGDFGPAPKEVEIASGGIKNYNIDMNFQNGQHKLKGVVTSNRENLYFVNFSKTVAHFRWLSDEDLEKLIEDRDPADAPSCPYKIQPGNQVNLT